jgi:hypothetical protein
MAAPWIARIVPAGAQTHDHSAMAAKDAADGEFNPFVVSDNRGGFYAAYVARKDGKSDVFFQRSLGNGRFSEAIRVNDRAGDATVRNENPPKIGVGSNNEVYVTWASERERWKGNIRFARSLNGGRSFEPAIDLNSDAARTPVSRAFQTILVDTRGRVFVAWIDERNKKESDRAGEVWLAVSEDRGKTFSSDRRILSDVCECCRIALASDSAGAIYLSYRVVPPSGPMFRDIAVARSADGGQTFKSSIVHADRWELNGCPIAGASMAIDTAGGVHVVWFTQSNDVPRLFIASSKDHGLSFGKPVAFDGKQKLARHAHAVAARNNRILIAWDNVDGGSMVRFGVYDPATQSTRMLGERGQASYPIIASNGDDLSIFALQPDRPEVLRIIQKMN